MPFKHDSTGVSAETTFVLLPEGTYTLKIEEAEEGLSKSGYNYVLAKCSVWNDSRYTSSSLWHYVTFLPKENKGAGMAVHFLKTIGQPHEGQYVVDAEKWIGKKFVGKVIQDMYEGKKRNKIAQISPLPNTVENSIAQDVSAKPSDEDTPF